ncbi:MAG: hypothetical protein NTY01_06885 [Verrucomicrobia bacterium]|nr:hypothetical protein [Verrucomicrobiota bacterium]
MLETLIIGILIVWFIGADNIRWALGMTAAAWGVTQLGASFEQAIAIVLGAGLLHSLCSVRGKIGRAFREGLAEP